jgi:ADP-ribose pyrophosphatase YjhB (NUDIX family)
VQMSYRPELSLPGGFLGRGETTKAAALRELEEETGLRAPAAAVTQIATLELRRHRAPLEVALFEWWLDAPPPLRIDGREIVRAGFVDLRALARASLSPELRFYLDHHAAAQMPVGLHAEAGIPVRADQPTP